MADSSMGWPNCPRMSPQAPQKQPDAPGECLNGGRTEITSVMPYTRQHPLNPPCPPGERILGQCRAQSRAGDPLPARWANPQSCTCVSPHTRGAGTGGRGGSTARFNPPPDLLPPSSYLPVSPPTYPPSCLYMRDCIALMRFSCASFPVLDPADVQVLSSVASLAWVSSLAGRSDRHCCPHQ